MTSVRATVYPASMSCVMIALFTSYQQRPVQPELTRGSRDTQSRWYVPYLL